MNRRPQNALTSVILGIDPGTIVTGYGLVLSEGNRFRPIDYGCIRPPAKAKLSDRYLFIFNGIEELIERHSPGTVVIETQFVHKNIQSALKLGMARGIVMTAAKKRGLPVYAYAPTEAKRAVTGNGKAGKFQVAGMIRHLLNLPVDPSPEDAADALALAICHGQCASHLIAEKEV